MPQSPRPILPATAVNPSSSTITASTPSSSSNTNPPDPSSAAGGSAVDLPSNTTAAAQQARARGRRTVTLVACFECQKKKTKCDGARPSCSRCLAKGSKCMWETDSREQTRQQATYNKLEEAVLKLEDANAKILHYERLLHALRTEPEDEAVRLLWRLRGDPEGGWLPEGMQLGVQGMEGMEGVVGWDEALGLEGPAGMGAFGDASGQAAYGGHGHGHGGHQAYGQEGGYGGDGGGRH